MCKFPLPFITNALQGQGHYTDDYVTAFPSKRKIVPKIWTHFLKFSTRSSVDNLQNQLTL